MQTPSIVVYIIVALCVGIAFSGESREGIRLGQHEKRRNSHCMKIPALCTFVRGRVRVTTTSESTVPECCVLPSHSGKRDDRDDFLHNILSAHHLMRN